MTAGPAILLALALPHVDNSSFVYRVCFRDTDYDVSMRPAERASSADMCVFMQTCAAAEVVVRLDPAAARTFWVSPSPEKCR